MTNSLTAMRTSFIAWGLFVAGTCAYCLLYQALVQLTIPDVSCTVSLTLRNWGAWLVVTPLLFGAWSRSADRPDRGAARMRAGLWTLLVTTAVPTLADQVAGTHDLAGSLAIHPARNVLAFAVMLLLWQVFLRRAPAVITPVVSAPPVSALPELPKTLLVNKGADQCLVSVDRVVHVAAAGNYVEIHAADQLYLLRATMGQAEALLPPKDFVRVHRSHFVRLEAIDRIRAHRSGAGEVILRGGKSVPISKRYRAELRKFRPELA